jgi:uncharacterized membrane protein HdeD (DUF308 family)
VSVGVCGRCGRFVCNDCSLYRRAEAFQARCTECILRADYAEAMKQLPGIKRGLPVWLALLGLLFTMVGGVAIANAASQENSTRTWLIGIAFTLCGIVEVVASAAFVRSPSSIWAWVGVGANGLPVLILAAAAREGQCATLFFGLVAARLALGAWRLQGFEDVLARAKERPDLFEAS